MSSILSQCVKHFDEFYFIADLLRATDNLIYPSADVNSCLEIFQKVLRAETDKHAHLKLRTIRCPQAVHMNSEWPKINHKRNMLRNAKDKYPTVKKTLNRIGNYGISQLKLASARDKFIFKNTVRVALRTHISGRQ